MSILQEAVVASSNKAVDFIAYNHKDASDFITPNKNKKKDVDEIIKGVNFES